MQLPVYFVDQWKGVKCGTIVKNIIIALKKHSKNNNQSRTNGPINAHLTIAQV